MLTLVLILLAVSIVAMAMPLKRAPRDALASRLAGFTLFQVAGALLLLLVVPPGGARTLAVVVLLLTGMFGIVAEARVLLKKAGE